jgi:hypothetical protein
VRTAEEVDHRDAEDTERRTKEGGRAADQR